MQSDRPYILRRPAGYILLTISVLESRVVTPLMVETGEVGKRVRDKERLDNQSACAYIVYNVWDVFNFLKKIYILSQQIWKIKKRVYTYIFKKVLKAFP